MKPFCSALTSERICVEQHCQTGLYLAVGGADSGRLGKHTELWGIDRNTSEGWTLNITAAELGTSPLCALSDSREISRL